MDEFELIKNYFQKISNNNPNAKKLNDDVFFDKKNKLIVSVDTYNEGVHFPNFKYPNLVIKKIIRSSISDLIAKGVKPEYYFISGSGNKNQFTKKNLKLISKSLNQEQKKYNLKLSGGDTTNFNKVSFSITSIGFSKKIIERNKAKLNDDIYVTGNLGDSFVGLQILKNKIKTEKKSHNYFLNKYYMPDIQIDLIGKILNFANSSIDISDGLFADLEKMLNKQNLSYQVNLDKIPISKFLIKLIKNNKIKKSNLISNGDDYQILFTASQNKSRIISNASKILGIKISKIGKINPGRKKSTIIDKKGKQIQLKNKGHVHQF